MSLTVDWDNRIVDSSASILDLSAAHIDLRGLESSPAGILYPSIIAYKEIDLGNGAKFIAIDFLHNFKLRFPLPGNYTIQGNLNAVIVPVAGVYVERKTSAAFAVTTSASGGGSSAPTSEQVAAQVRIELTAELLRILGLPSATQNADAVWSKVLS